MLQRMRWIFPLLLIILSFVIWSFAYTADAQKTKPFAALLKIQGEIGPATQDYFKHNLNKAITENARLIILQIDTPGGLSTSMRGIIKNILASPIPIIAYVAPSGARAASAGTYILYASHIAAMAPGTNLGAATPVQMGGNSTPLHQKTKNSKPDIETKTTNDARAYIRSLAQLRGRNEAWAERAVTEAASLSAQEALKMNVINFMAADIPELLQKINGMKIQVNKQIQSIDSKDLPVKFFKPGWRTQFLSIITNPSIAYVLLLVGFYGLVFEFSNPGMIAPGVIGGICLFVGMYALQLLPINYAGLALIVLGLSLLIAEIFMPTVGILGIGGIISFAIGSIMLMKTDAIGFTLPLQLILGVTITTGLFFLLMIQLAWRGRQKPIVSGTITLVGKAGVIIKEKRNTWVKIDGEYWKAQSTLPLHDGQPVIVKSVSGLALTVE